MPKPIPLRLRLSRRAIFGLLFSLAVLLRLAAAFYLGEDFTGPQQERVYDQVSYQALARSLLGGRGYSFEQFWYPFTPADTATAHWSFVYPLFLAGVYAIFGLHPLAARLIQAVASGILATWLVYCLGRRLFGATAGLLAAGLSAVYAYFIFHDAALMTESYFILGVLAMLNLTLQLVERPASGGPQEHGLAGPGKWLLLGVVLGLSALLRQTILLWLPFLFGWIAWAGHGRVRWWGPALALGITALLVLPWTVRNYVVYHAFLPLNSNVGYALYSANHPDHGTNFDQDYAAPLPADLERQGLNEAQWNSALTLRGVRFILQDPARYARLSLDRVGVFFNFWFSPESSLASNLMRVLSFGLYLPFFLWGLALSRRNWQPATLIYLFVLVFSAMHILTWASIRYRLPVDAALMPFAALAVEGALSRVRKMTGKARAPAELQQTSL